MAQQFVAVLMGSDSDLPVLEPCFSVLKSLAIPFEARITSAHRSPAATRQYVVDAEQRGCAVFIAAAGMAAHLAGAVAANTIRPVIGIPVASSLNGLDALLSTVQMPGGIPVGTVAIGKAGAKNAAWLAAQVLALSDTALTSRLQEARATNAAAVADANAALQERLQG